MQAVSCQVWPFCFQQAPVVSCKTWIALLPLASSKPPTEKKTYDIYVHTCLFENIPTELFFIGILLILIYEYSYDSTFLYSLILRSPSSLSDVKKYCCVLCVYCINILSFCSGSLRAYDMCTNVMIVLAIR